MDGENDRKPREERFPVIFMCEMLGVSRQGYYAWKKRAPSARQKEDVTLTTLIVAIHDAHKGRYGIDRIHADPGLLIYRAGCRGGCGGLICDFWCVAHVLCARFVRKLLQDDWPAGIGG